MEYLYGLPLVNAENIFEVVKDLGIRPFTKLSAPMSVDEYMKLDLSIEQLDGLKHLPEIKVKQYRTSGGGHWDGFVTCDRDNSLVFVLLPDDLLIVAAEFKHGAEQISILPPGGIIDYGEDPVECARREFKQETGLTLAEVIPLAINGIFMNTRRTSARAYPFLGKIKFPPEISPVNLDKEEFLKTLIIPLSNWIELIHKGHINDWAAIIITYLALKKMGRVHIR